MPARTAIAPLLLGVALGATPLAAQHGETDRSVELREWIRGPVRYLSLKQEAKQFKAIEGDGARALFIEQFWARRDPSPETLTNEYRQIFWERVNEANSVFTDSPKPGWKTDRGKIHILYGPPNEIQEDVTLRTEDSIPGGGFGLIRWIYTGRPRDRKDLDTIVVVPFVRDGSGEYRVSIDPNLSSVFFDAHAIRTAKYDLGNRQRAQQMGGGRSPLSVMLDLGKMQEVPPQEQVILERVETSEAYDTSPINVTVDRYYRPQDGQPMVVLNVDLAETNPEANPAVIARLAPVGGDSGPRMLGEESFRLEQLVESRMAQSRLAVAPGSYVLTVMVADPVDVKTRMHRSTIEVPRMSERMRFSDFVLADQLEPLPFRAMASYDEPYIVGPFRVVPKLSPIVLRGEEIRLFYEVYGAAGPFTVTYQLEGMEDDGSWVALGRPSSEQREAISQAWALPTGERWPLGDYRVRVEVQDADGRLISAQVPFRLSTPAGNS